MIPLHRLLIDGETPTETRSGPGTGTHPAQRAPVCYDRGEWLGWDAFLRRVRQVHAVIDRLPASARRVLVYLDDPYAFACTLFGVLAAGREPVIPAHAAPGYWAQLASQRAYDIQFTESEWHTLPPDAAASLALDEPVGAVSARGPFRLPALALPAEATLTLFTSGSSAMPKPIRKTLAQLDEEVRTIDAQWGHVIADAVVQSGVPHHHIYGMSFHLLWPLATGRPFARAQCSGPGDWQVPPLSSPHPAMSPISAMSPLSVQAALSPSRWIVVSTPAQLARWPELSGFGNGGACLFLSAGAPLSAPTAALYRRAFGAAPLEVYGSTETGAIAWRRQAAEPDTLWWTPFPGVEVRRTSSGTLAVRSAHLSASDDPVLRAQGFVTADAVEMDLVDLAGTAGSDDRPVAADAGTALIDTGSVSAYGRCRFVLGGRIDRIAKVAGKRVSLPEIEAALATHPHVARTVTVALEGTGRSDLADKAGAATHPHEHNAPDSSERVIASDRIGALVVLTDAGNAALFDTSHFALTRALRQFLMARMDPGAVPRYWRFVEDLPYDARGKLPANVVRAAFIAPQGMPELLSFARQLPAILLDTAPLSAGSEGDGRIARQWRYTLRVPKTLVQFQGHFPVQPILPGVVQLDWAIRYATRQVPQLAGMVSVEQLKFTAPVLPGAVLQLLLTHETARDRVTFRYTMDGRPCASGTLQMAAATADGADPSNPAAHEQAAA